MSYNNTLSFIFSLAILRISLLHIREEEVGDLNFPYMKNEKSNYCEGALATAVIWSKFQGKGLASAWSNPVI